MKLLSAAEYEGRDERVEAAFLMARAAVHTADPSRALVALDEVAALREGPQERIIDAMLRGSALAQLGHFDEALPLLELAAADAAADVPALRDDTAFDLAHGYFAANRLDDAQWTLDARPQTRNAAGNARALELFGWIEMRRERYPIAARHFLDALELVRTAERLDAVMHAALLYGLTSISLDMLDLKLFERVRLDVEGILWSAGIEHRWSAIRRNRTFVELLEGNAIEAWRLADEALCRSPRGVQHVAALITAARVSRAAGDLFTPQRLVQKAVTVAVRVDWRATSLQDRAILLDAIRDAAAIDVPAAVRLLELYQELPAAPAAVELYLTDPSTKALESLARAALARARGEGTEAASRLRAALAIWRGLGKRYDEALALLMLIEIATSEDALRRADELTSVVPRSWLRRRYAVLAERARHVQQLSPAEHRVMMQICEGRSTAEIAMRFSRSKNTIRNQTRRVYEVMAVRSRAGLVSKCAALGIIAGAPAAQVGVALPML